LLLSFLFDVAVYSINRVLKRCVVLENFYLKEFSAESGDSFPKKFKEAVEANLKLHQKGEFNYANILDYQTEFRLKLLEMYQIPVGNQVDMEKVKNADCTTSLFTIVRGTNASKYKLVDLDNMSQDYKDTVTVILFLDNCYNIETVRYVHQLFFRLYSDLHHEATQSHNLQPTAIVTYDLCYQIMSLHKSFTKVLVAGAEGLSTLGLIKLKDGNNKVIPHEVIKKKAKVVASVFSYFSILFIIETVGLYPIIKNLPWKYKDLQVDTFRSETTILAFIMFAFEKQSFQARPFHNCFSKMLLDFLEAQHKAAKSKSPDIFQFMNVVSYKENIKNWVKNYAIVNNFQDFFKSIICSSKGAPVVITSQNNRDKERIKRGLEGTSSASSSNRTESALPSNTGHEPRLVREPLSTAASSPSKKTPRITIVEFKVKPFRSSPNPKGCNRNERLCENCCSEAPVPRKNKEPKLQNWARVEVVEMSTPRKVYQVCFVHARRYHYHYSIQSQYEIIGDIDEIYKEENRDSEFVNEPKEYDEINVSLLPGNIADKIRSNISPVKECAQNKGLRIECPSDCDGGSSCENKQLSFIRSINNFDKRLVRKPTNTEKGDGLFAAKDYSPGELMIEFIGQAVLNEGGTDFPNSKYIMQLQDNCYIDAEKFGNLSRFINHSCDPNATVEKYTVRLRLCVAYNSFRK